MTMTTHRTGSTLLDTALAQVDKGINVAIVPVHRTPGNDTTMFAVLQNPSQHKALHAATYSDNDQSRAAAAMHLILRARKAAVKLGMRPT
jgi:hypothetical protein